MSEQYRYELNIDFSADERNAHAFYDALAMILEAWQRHNRLKDVRSSLDKSEEQDSQ